MQMSEHSYLVGLSLVDAEEMEALGQILARYQLTTSASSPHLIQKSLCQTSLQTSWQSQHQSSWPEQLSEVRDRAAGRSAN